MKKHQRDDLDKYVAAYEGSFPYAHDNHGVLTAYAAEFVNTCAGLSGGLDICSLGIGYEIVSRTIGAQLRDRIKSYTAIEGSRVLIERYRKSSDLTYPINLVHAYFEDYQSEKKFDVIEMGFVLEHVEDPTLIVSRFAAMLKQGGVITAAVPNALSMHRVLGQRAGLLPNPYKLSDWDRQLGHRRYFDADTFRHLFADLGLHVSRESGLMLKPLATSQLEMLGLPENVWEVLFASGDLAPRHAYGLFAEVQLPPATNGL